MFVAIWLLSLGVSGQQQVKETFPDVTSVAVEGLFCQVSIDAVAGSNVDFDGRVSSASGELEIKYSLSGTELKVWVEAPAKWDNSFSGSLVFKVPRSTNINVDNISGNITVKGVAGKEIGAKSISGNVQASGIQSDFKAETVSGNIEVVNVDGRLSAKSVSGNVDVSQVGGVLHASTVSGGVSAKKVQGQATVTSISGGVQVLGANNQVSANAVSGGVLVRDVKGDVECKNISGTISMANVSGSVKAKTVSGSINGENLMLAGQSTFESHSGNIDMGLANPADSVSFNLKTFSGRLNARGLIGKERLQVQKGTVSVKGDSFSGDQNYR